MSGAFKGAERK